MAKKKKLIRKPGKRPTPRKLKKKVRRKSTSKYLEKGYSPKPVSAQTGRLLSLAEFAYSPSDENPGPGSPGSSPSPGV